MTKDADANISWLERTLRRTFAFRLFLFWLGGGLTISVGSVLLMFAVWNAIQTPTEGWFQAAGQLVIGLAIVFYQANRALTDAIAKRG